MNIFLDTSALIKLYHQEKGTDRFSQFIQDHITDLYMTITDLSIIELHSALSKRLRSQEIKSESLTHIYSLFRNDFDLYKIARNH